MSRTSPPLCRPHNWVLFVAVVSALFLFDSVNGAPTSNTSQATDFATAGILSGRWQHDEFVKVLYFTLLCTYCLVLIILHFCSPYILDLRASAKKFFHMSFRFVYGERQRSRTTTPLMRMLQTTTTAKVEATLHHAWANKKACSSLFAWWMCCCWRWSSHWASTWWCCVERWKPRNPTLKSRATLAMRKFRRWNQRESPSPRDMTTTMSRIEAEDGLWRMSGWCDTTTQCVHAQSLPNIIWCWA